MLTALAGLLTSLPLLWCDGRTVRLLKLAKRNGRLLNAARERHAVAIIFSLTQATLVLTCLYRLIIPMDGHWVPSSSRLLLSLSVTACVTWIYRNRRRYPMSQSTLVLPKDC
jgi:hypothetical protein